MNKKQIKTKINRNKQGKIFKEIHYDINGNILYSNDKGKISKFKYDEQNKLIYKYIRDNDGREYEYNYYYDEQQRISKFKSNTLEKIYNYLNDKEYTITYSDGTISHIKLDENGNIIFNQNDITRTIMKYNENNKCTYEQQINISDGKVISEYFATYNENGKLIYTKSIYKNKIKETEIEYNNKDQLIGKIVNGQRIYYHTEYDENGNIILQTDSLGNESIFKYDSNNILIYSKKLPIRWIDHKKVPSIKDQLNENCHNDINFIDCTKGLSIRGELREHSYKYNDNNDIIKLSNHITGKNVFIDYEYYE